ncbi:MAG: folate family ECF transporter S component [Firmicutes bacterium]|nr:folate family ECF transporter S component [Bacillota bacterium]
MQQSRLSRLVTTALLLAISIVARRFLSINTPIISIGLGWLPILVVGIAYGPGWGFIAGALGDFIGANLFPIGAYFPGFTLSSGLAGAIVPLLLGRNRWRSSYWQLLGAIAVSEVITSVVLNTYWLTIITGKAAAVLLPVRVANAAATIVVMTSLLYALRHHILRVMRVR